MWYCPFCLIVKGFSVKGLEVEGVRIKIIIIRIIIRIKKRHCNNRKDSDGIVGILNKEKTLQ